MSTTTSAVVDIGDLPVALRGSDARRADAIARLLPGAPRHAGPAEIVIRCLRRRPGTPRRRPDHRYDGVALWHDGDALVVQTDWGFGAAVTADRAWIGGDAEELDAACHGLFHFAVTHVLAHRQRHVLHAAGIVDPVGRGYVVLGDSGQGKSTLALAALHRGWRLLSDDLVIVRRVGSALEIQGIPRRLCVPGDLVHGLGYDTSPLAGDPRGRRELPVEHLTRGWFSAAGVTVVGHSPAADGERRVMASNDTLDRVLGSFSSVTDPRLLREFFPVAAALTRLGATWVGHGATAATRIDVAGRLLTGVQH